MVVQVVQIEFNELSPVLLRDFMSQGHLPNFRRIFETSNVFVTDAHATEPELEPWVQWPTVHLGVDHSEHGIRQLGDIDNQQRSPVAKVLSDAGHRVGICGSMNVPYGILNGFVLPDPWSTQPIAAGDPLAPFRHTVSTMVRESSRPEVPDNARFAAFAKFMVRNGLSRATSARILRQLATERRNPKLRWRRASVLDWLQYDVFRKLTTRHDVEFATFFSNSTAHYQHYYWRDMDPERFVVQPDITDGSLAEAVLFGYRSMDMLLSRFLHDFPAATFILCTALSQAPWYDATKMTYRPQDFPLILHLAGINPAGVEIRPIMAEEFVLRFANERAASEGADLLSRLSVDSAPLMRFVQNGRELTGGCAITRADAGRATIDGGQSPSLYKLEDIFYPIHAVRSGRHSAEGVLWIRTGIHQTNAGSVKLVDIAPTVLNMFRVPPPGHMQGQRLTLVWPSPVAEARA